MKSKQRLEWVETKFLPEGSTELFYIIAEWEGDKWMFYERTSWDICWKQIPPTPLLSAKAGVELAKK